MKSKSKPELHPCDRGEWLQCLQAAATVAGKLNGAIYPENLTAVANIADLFYEMLEERKRRAPSQRTP